MKGPGSSPPRGRQSGKKAHACREWIRKEQDASFEEPAQRDVHKCGSILLRWSLAFRASSSATRAVILSMVS
jgi:hypothetical protein